MPDLKQYRLPDAPCAVMFSGGRSSAYMLFHILEAHDGVLPETAKVLFQNTGKERPETLDFIHECETRWNCEVVWLEYRFRHEAAGGRKDPKNVTLVVDYETASRKGEPFESMILKARGGYLPNPVRRMCTEELKIMTSQRYLRRVCGWRKWHGVLGIRGDEPRRLTQRISPAEFSRIYPMACDGVTHGDILNWWKAQPFDLKISSDEGNCDLCFLKGRNKLVQLIRQNPSMADWWVNMETYAGIEAKQRNKLKDTTMSQFRKEFRYSDLVKQAESQLDLNFPDDTSTDCFCTD